MLRLSLSTLTLALTLAGAAQAQTLIGGGKTAPTFPIVISQPGSYKLAGNLVVTDLGTTAIRVQSGNVTIDLGGFTISGPNLCDRASLTCTAPSYGGGYGILTTPVRGVTVRNGTISGFAGGGISAGGFLRVEDVAVEHNTGGGISAGSSAHLDRVVARLNGPDRAAISVDSGLITNSEASFNLGHGIRHGHLVNVISTNNQGAGFWAPASYQTVQQSRSGVNAGGHFLGNVQSMGNNFCSNVIC